jgi:hypothetical protein
LNTAHDTDNWAYFDEEVVVVVDAGYMVDEEHGIDAEEDAGCGEKVEKVVVVVANHQKGLMH